MAADSVLKRLLDNPDGEMSAEEITALIEVSHVYGHISYATCGAKESVKSAKKGELNLELINAEK